MSISSKTFVNCDPLRVRAVAFHEAGHAAFILASPQANTLKRVAITPENPMQGGITETDVAGGQRKMASDHDRELGRRLAGPLAQVKFVGESIPEELRSGFNKEILKTIGVKKLFAEARSLGWESDLSEFMSTLESNLAADSESSFELFLSCEESSAIQPYGAFLANEARLRRWMNRNDVSELIRELAGKLSAEGCLSRDECRKTLARQPSVRGSVRDAGFDDGDDAL